MTSEYIPSPLPPQSHSPSTIQEPTSSRNYPNFDPSIQHSGDASETNKPETPRADSGLELHDITIVAEPESNCSEDSTPSKRNSDTRSEEDITVLMSPPALNNIQDQTLPDMPHREDLDALQGSNITADWDPLRGAEDAKEQRRVHDATLVIEGDVVDPNGRVLFTDNDTDSSPVGSRRASHLRLDIKPPSPQPWDLIEPPTSNNDKPHYSPVASQKFHSMQNATHTRPLIPKSSYYFGPPPSDSAYGTPPVGQIGIHHPREILRVERDYTGGELIQFAPIYPLELEGRITPTQFLESINSINEVLISAHSLRHAFLDSMLSIFTLQLSRLILTTHYEKEMQRLKHLIDDLNVGLYNPVGLNIMWPRDVAFLFLEIEYY